MLDNPARYNRRRVGAWRTCNSILLVNNQAAASRIWQIRNSAAANFLIIQRLFVSITQTGANTAAIYDELNVWKLTGFTALDNANNTARNAFPLNGGAATTTPGAAQVNAVTGAGNSAGTTGGTMTRDAVVAILPMNFLQTLPTAGPVPYLGYEVVPPYSEYVDPIMLGPNEGLVIENRNLLGATAGAAVVFDCTWIEVALS